jgi:hypothetical protein
MTMLRGIPSLLVLAFAALAQYPGQYPPGQSPGRYPPGTTSPLPRIPGQTDPAGRPRTPQPDGRGKRTRSDATKLPTTTNGILRRVAANQLVIQPDDHRVVWYRLAPQLKVQKDGKDADLKDFALGDYLSVDSNSDEDGIMTAVSVTWKKAGTPEDRAEAAKSWDLPRLETAARSVAKPASNSSASSPPRQPDDDRPVLRRQNPQPQPDKSQEVAAAPPKQEEPDPGPPATIERGPDVKPDADDPGRPVLKRGAPAPRRETVEEPPVQREIPPTPTVKAPVAEVLQPIIPVQDDPIIMKAREAAFVYSETLPNYLVQQMTTRYQSDRPKSSWTALDIVTADLAYQDGRESYKNIKVGNKSVDKPMDEIPGTRSTGEFSTMLEQLFEESAARFKSAGQDTIHNRPAYRYNFEITRELSRWRIEAPSQLYYPAMKGSVWIDKETSRVLRIEQQGKPMPALFPFDTIESSADYDFIRLGTSGPYLLPVEAEVLSCQRGTSICSRNKIEFRNYRKFGAESNVTFDKP